MGPIEEQIRAELKGNSSALALIAYNLAAKLDQDEGNASTIRELRFLLKELTPRRAFRGLGVGVSRSPGPDYDEEE
jgi:predicted protein tyrosine phosphatase